MVEIGIYLPLLQLERLSSVILSHHQIERFCYKNMEDFLSGANMMNEMIVRHDNVQIVL
jgi:hypothetical protein